MDITNTEQNENTIHSDVYMLDELGDGLKEWCRIQQAIFNLAEFTTIDNSKVDDLTKARNKKTMLSINEKQLIILQRQVALINIVSARIVDLSNEHQGIN